MTQKEFYLRAMLAMASNPKYVEMRKDEDNGTDFPVLLTEAIEIDAKDLAEEARTSWPDCFDNPFEEPLESRNKLLENIGTAIENLASITEPDGKLDMLYSELADMRRAVEGMNQYVEVRIKDEDE